MKGAEWIGLAVVAAVLLVVGVVYLLLRAPMPAAPPDALLLNGVGAEPVVTVVDAMQLDVVRGTGNGA